MLDSHFQLKRRQTWALSVQKVQYFSFRHANLETKPMLNGKLAILLVNLIDIHDNYNVM